MLCSRPLLLLSHSSRLFRITLFLCLTVLLALPTHAAVLHVPADHATVQAGVDAAATGDTVLVAPGTYLENIRVYDRGIVLASEFILDGDPATIEATVLDGSAEAQSDTGSVVLFHHTPAEGAVLRGFTVLGGGGFRGTGNGGGTFREGGGVMAYNAQGQEYPVAIRDCVIRDNIVEVPGGSGGRGGAGISMWNVALTVERCVIARNIGQLYGGGLVTNFGSAEVRNNLFIANSLRQNAYSGVAIYYFNTPTIGYCEQNTFQGHFVEVGSNPALIISDSPLAQTTFRNNIYDESMIVHWAPYGGSATISHSLTSGGSLSGEDIIEADPAFAVEGYVLTATSPAVDVGSGDPGDREDMDNPGWAAYPAQATVVRDLGTYGGPDAPAAVWPLSWMETSVDQEPSSALPANDALLRLYPNPFNASSTLAMTLPRPGVVTVNVLNLLGQRVASWEVGRLPSGTHRVPFQAGTLASGTCLLQTRLNGTVHGQVRAIVLN